MAVKTPVVSVDAACDCGTRHRSAARSMHAGNWLLFLLPLIFICLPVHAADWTIMVYLDADNNLEGAGIDDFLEISSVANLGVDVNVVLLFDRINGYDSSYGNWTDTRYGQVTSGDTPTAAWGVSKTELNMGNPTTVVNFVTEAVGDYPAANYALIFWNHGGGWRSREGDKQKDGPIRAVCWDDTNGGDCLYMSEVKSALNNLDGVGINVHLIGFDACLMAMLEVAYEIKDYGNVGEDFVMVGSEEVEPGDGWPYNTFVADLVDDPGMDAVALGSVIVDRYYSSYGTDWTQSAIDLALVGNVATETDALAVLLIADHTIEAPIKAAAANVITAITAAVINEKHGTSWPGTNGLSIYFPSAVGDYEGAYATVIDLSVDYQWDQFLAAYYQTMAGTWIDTARAGSQEYSDPAFIDLYNFCMRLDYLDITTVGPLPAGDVGTPYSTTIVATGGEVPYQWSVPDYAESNPGTGWAGGGVPRGWQDDDQSWLYSLPFTFNYYGTNRNSVWVSSNGYLDFVSSADDWTPTTAELASNVRIAPLWDDLVTDSGVGQDIYITEWPSQVIIRWQGETWDSFGLGDPVNFEVVLYQAGNIKFNYGAAHSGIRPTVGVSSGDGSRYTLSTRDGALSIQANVSSLFGPNALPPGLSIDAGTGEISGTPTIKGAYNFSIGVADSSQNPQVCSKAFAMNITGPPIVEFTVASTSGAESVTSVNLAVSLDEIGDVLVDYAVTVGGTATGGGVDYTLASGTLTFDSGVTAADIPITIVNDNLNEADETILVTLSNPVGATLGATAMHMYIIVDDDPAVGFTVAAASGAESVTSVNLEVSLNKVGGDTVTVDYAVTGGTATGGGVDYTLASDTLTFAPGDTAKDILITVVDDELAEDAETILVTLSNPVNAALGATVAHTYTIIANDPIVVSIVTNKTHIRVSEGSTAAFSVKLASDPVASVTVGVSKTQGEPTITVTEGSALVFDSRNWSAWQTVVLFASEDSNMDENSATITCSGGTLVPAIVIATKYDNDRMRAIGGGGGCFIAAARQHR